MNYPLWEVPIIGGAWVIGLIAIYHVMIAHFAVGGGLYLALAERKAIREGKTDWLPAIQRHSKFFLILTGVFGAVSGVGIWFSIGLVHPEATSTLIHNFVFGWAIEWVFFIIELSAALVYYYTWNRIPQKLHLQVGYLYAGASLCTLVIINGILTFMLTPGQSWLSVAGTGQEASRFWQAFFNPTYWPSLGIRILSCTSLAGVWALVTMSRLHGEVSEKTRTSIIRWSASWLMPSFLLMPFLFVWLIAMVPADNRGLLQLGMTTIGSGMFTAITRIAMTILMTTVTITGVVYFFAYKSPEDFSYGHATAILILALAVTAAGEYSREALRKPYVIGRHMYSNGVRVAETEKFNQDGYLTNCPWVAAPGAIPTEAETGKAMFRGQCMSCHTETGYRSMRKFVQDRDAKGIANLLTMLHDTKKEASYHKYMPPLVGKPEEIAALGVYLGGLNHKGQFAPVAAVPMKFVLKTSNVAHK